MSMFAFLAVVGLTWVGVVVWVWQIFAALLRPCQGNSVVEDADE